MALFFCLSCSSVFADTYNTKFNPFTKKLDYVNTISKDALLLSQSNPQTVSGIAPNFPKPTFDIDTIYGAGLKVNAQCMSGVSLLTYNGNQYAGFYNDAGKLTLAKRILPNGLWAAYVYDGTGGRPNVAAVTNDDHNNAAIGVDKNGYIHICWDMHAVALKYMKSANPEDVSNAANSTMLGTNETSVTYPLFFNDKNGELYFDFRDGASGNGDMYIYHYNTTSSTWEAAAGTGTAGIVLDGKNSSPNENPYFTAPHIDANNDAYFWWSWRETDALTDAHDVCFMRWDIDAGKFYKSTDVQYTLPITQETAEIVVPVAKGLYIQDPIYKKAITTDSAGNVHITWTRDDSAGCAQVYYIKKTAGGSWGSVIQLTQSSEAVTTTVSQPSLINYPMILCDKDDILYILYIGISPATGIQALRSIDKGSTWTRYALLNGFYSPLMNIDLQAWDATNDFYLIFQDIISTTMSYTRRPVYLFHTKLSQPTYVAPVNGGMFTSHDDLLMGTFSNTSKVKLFNLTTNGLVKTMSSSGVLTVDSEIYVTQGYTLQGGNSSTNPVDATTYYSGQAVTNAIQTTAAVQRVYIPKAGTIKSAYVSFVNSVLAGTNETSTVSIRLNNTTDTTISSTVDLEFVYNSASNTGLSIPVVAGDYVELKWVTPTWVTNPQGTVIFWTIYID